MYSGTISADSWGDDDQTNRSSGNWKVVAKWIPGSIVVAILLFFPSNLAGETRNYGKYDPVLYREWRYAKIARNAFEGEASATTHNEEVKPLMRDEEEAIDMPAYPPTRSYESLETSSTVTSWPAAKFPGHAVMKRELGPKFLCFVFQEANGDLTVSNS